jgi:hypothetical protein
MALTASWGGISNDADCAQAVEAQNMAIAARPQFSIALCAKIRMFFPILPARFLDGFLFFDLGCTLMV